MEATVQFRLITFTVFQDYSLNTACKSRTGNLIKHFLMKINDSHTRQTYLLKHLNENVFSSLDTTLNKSPFHPLTKFDQD